MVVELEIHRAGRGKGRWIKIEGEQGQARARADGLGSLSVLTASSLDEVGIDRTS